MKERIYWMITRRPLDLDGLDDRERAFLARVRGRYETRPECSELAAWWIAASQELGLEKASPVHRVCQDLQARLGIAQGDVAPPDYRD
ncbi:MAG: hypothetical protein HYV63_29470 [Candidatus Schekmanbacteria bacterium]|nr:hypothetical protein [Candidatus Schekmanbacteria bacterium]